METSPHTWKRSLHIIDEIDRVLLGKNFLCSILVYYAGAGYVPHRLAPIALHLQALRFNLEEGLIELVLSAQKR